jgi:molybdopterin molybdotransferase
MPVADALQRILQGVMPLGPEQIGVRFAAGRTLAHALASSLTHPPFDASAMDGYAVRSGDTVAPPTTLKVSGESAAGWPFGGTVKTGEAVRIFTGAKLPDGADAVVVQENVKRDGDLATLSAPVASGDHVRARGIDFHEGDTIFKRGHLLNARDILYAAAAGHAMLAVAQKPLVAILATGDELVEPTDRPQDGQIVSSNPYGLAALFEAAGATVRLLGIALDDKDDLANKIRTADNADILVTVGGASVGEHDLVRPVLAEAGATLHFHEIAMRPGKPLFFGTRDGHHGIQRIVGLAGNPLSAMIAGRVFVVPLIAALLGRTAEPRMLKANLAAGIPANGPRDHYMRAILDQSAHPACVTPLASQDSSLVSALAAADCLIVVPAHAPRLAAGTGVDVMLLDF